MKKRTSLFLALVLSLGLMPLALAEENALPIVQEPIEMNFMSEMFNSHSEWNEMLVWKEYAARTNIKINWEAVPMTNFVERRNLSLAADVLPDAYWACKFTAGELAIYGADGLFIPLEDLIEEHMPNLTRRMEENPAIRAAITMPDGHIYSLPSLYEESPALMAGLKLFVQPAWLENLGLTMPTTTDEFYEMLVAFKEQDADGDGDPNNEIPLGTASSGLLPALVKTFLGSWDLMNRGEKHENVDIDRATGALRFFRTDAKYKEVLEYLHKMYAEGLIEPEIFTIDAPTRVAKGNTGIYGALNSITGAVVNLPDSYTGVPVLKGPYGDQIFTNVGSAVAHGGQFVITADNKYPVETAKWVDYFFGDDGMLLLFMGVEGETFTYVDGVPTFVDDILHNPDGMTLDTALARYSPRPGGEYISVVSPKYFSGYETQPDAIAAALQMEPYFLPVEERWLPFTFTTEEAEALRGYEDLLTYVKNMTAKFVKGDEPLSNWDAYVKQVENMDIAGYLAIYQAARERYEASVD